LSGGTYTAVAPDVPVAHTYTFGASAALVVDNDSPWDGQYLADLDVAYNSYVTSTLSSATMQATSGRVYIEGEGKPNSGGSELLRLAPTTALNGRVKVEPNGTNMRVAFTVDGGNEQAEVDLGTWPASPYAVEIIYDRGAATANERLRARTWALSGSPGSFVNSSPTISSGTTDQYTLLQLNYSGDTPDSSPLQVNRIIISNDPAEDLSAVSEGGGAAVGLMGGMSL